MLNSFVVDVYSSSRAAGLRRQRSEGRRGLRDEMKGSFHRAPHRAGRAERVRPTGAAGHSRARRDLRVRAPRSVTRTPETGASRSPRHLADRRFPETPSSWPTRTTREERCLNCGASFEGLRRCGKCKAVYFCNAACQREVWKEHCKTCVAPAGAAPPPPPEAPEPRRGVRRPRGCGGAPAAPEQKYTPSRSSVRACDVSTGKFCLRWAR